MRRTVLVGFLIALVHAAYGQGPNIVCPGGQAQCPSGSTCCKLASGQWGCCPQPLAVCCSDQIHCCPHGYTCDVSAGTCSQGMLTTPWVEKNVAKPLKVEIVQCGGGSECPDGNTCCKLASGEWGCCPFPKAVCCSDGVHCCQEGYTCDVSAGTCSKGMLTLPWAEKNVAKPLKVEDVVCPGGQSQCPTGNTCCKLASGEWGCCPLPQAVCCSDHTHCCPNGYTCDVSTGSCSQGMLTIPWAEKNVAKPVEVEVVVCPGNGSTCPSGSTCCKLASGQWGCCPLPKAVCCSDHTHCCPQGYTCDVSAGSCSQGMVTLPWVEKNVAKPVEVEDVVCPGGTSQCPNGSTCCRLASGQYGCCPLPKAVCCSDHEHCCPNGYTCDVSAGSCSQGMLTIPWAEKNVAKPVENNVEGTVCPNSTAVCNTSETCCKLKSGMWGCCPGVETVCCTDGIHCCPKDTKCAAKNTCVGTFGGSRPMLTKTKAKEMAPKVKPILWMTKTVALPRWSKVGSVQCDSTHYCPSGNTCCRLASGQWGCCPIPKAVCCSDHQHCCPSGYTCQTGTGECVRSM